MTDFDRYPWTKAKKLADIIDRAQRSSSETFRKALNRPVEPLKTYEEGYAKGWADAWARVRAFEEHENKVQKPLDKDTPSVL